MMISQKPFRLVFFTSILGLVKGQATGPYPPCEACGCSFCPAGLTMANPTAVFSIPEANRGLFGGLETIVCSNIQALGANGDVPPEACIDEFRLFQDYRVVCGCPLISPPTSEPTSEPTPATTAEPTPVPPPEPSADPSTISPSSTLTSMPTGITTACNVCGCDTCGDNLVMANRDAIMTFDPPLMLPGDSDVSTPSMPCSLLDDITFAGTSDGIAAILCDDSFRLDETFRATCGCPVIGNIVDTPDDKPAKGSGEKEGEDDGSKSEKSDPDGDDTNTTGEKGGESGGEKAGEKIRVRRHR